MPMTIASYLWFRLSFLCHILHYTIITKIFFWIYFSGGLNFFSISAFHFSAVIGSKSRSIFFVFDISFLSKIISGKREIVNFTISNFHTSSSQDVYGESFQLCAYSLRRIVLIRFLMAVNQNTPIVFSGQSKFNRLLKTIAKYTYCLFRQLRICYFVMLWMGFRSSTGGDICNTLLQRMLTCWRSWRNFNSWSLRTQNR